MQPKQLSNELGAEGSTVVSTTFNRVVAISAIVVTFARCSDRRQPEARVTEQVIRSTDPAHLTEVDLVRADQYSIIDNAGQIPADVRSSLTQEFGEPEFEMASGSEPFNGGCLIQPGLARRRLLLAAVSPRFAVVHFEVGGFAVSQHVIVLRRNGRKNAEKIRSNLARSAWGERHAFISALRSGELLVDITSNDRLIDATNPLYRLNGT